MRKRKPGRRIIATSFVLAALALQTLACHRADAAGAAGASATTGAPKQDEDELMGYIDWQHDQIQLTNEHVAELDAESQRLAARNPVLGSNVARDPDLIALSARQREAMQRLMTRAPNGPNMMAIGETVAGVGHSVPGERGMTYVPGRDEAALSAARAKYGDDFVSWVLKHERTINERLASASAR